MPKKTGAKRGSGKNVLRLPDLEVRSEELTESATLQAGGYFLRRRVIKDEIRLVKPRLFSSARKAIR
jgi:hypothetical protein